MSAVWLTDVKDDAEHGGKAAQLGAALRAGLPVPPGFALAHEHVDEIAGIDAHSAPPHIEEAFASLGGPVAVRSSPSPTASASDCKARPRWASSCNA